MKKLLTILLTAYSLFLFPSNCKSQFKYTTLHAFNGTDGSTPLGSLAISGSELYGMTQLGGAHNVGCVFSIDTNGNGYTDILDFDTANGSTPWGDVTVSGTTLYGMTSLGGANGKGCIFSVQTNGSGYADLLDFDSTNGANPRGSLTLSGATLYGMTFAGGASNVGRIFSIQTNGSGYTNIMDFNIANGANPYGSLLLNGTTLYGMASAGGLHTTGLIFAIQTNGSFFKDIRDYRALGGNPEGNLILTGKMLYGMSNSAGNWGDIFHVDTAGSVYYSMHYFSMPRENYPTGSLVMVDSLVYGMIADGGPNYYGNIFAIDTSGTNYHDPIKFDSSQGWYPFGSLIYAGHAFYGMAQGGNFLTQNGIIFKFEDTPSALSGTKQLSVISGQLSVYPNPSNGIFTIVGTQNFVSANIEVYNVLGEKVLEETLRGTQGDKAINLTEQPNGVYFYRVLDENGKSVGNGKLIINK